MHDANAAIAESSDAPADDAVAAPVPHAISRHRRRAGSAFVLKRCPSLGG